MDSPAAGVLQMMASLLLVLGLIFGLAWLLRRVQGLRPGAAALLRINGGVQVGARERVLMVQAGDVHLLIGVAPGRVNLLHQFSEAPKLAEAAVTTPAFAEALKRALGRGETA